jgi:hypothetical protein
MTIILCHDVLKWQKNFYSLKKLSLNEIVNKNLEKVKDIKDIKDIDDIGIQKEMMYKVVSNSLPYFGQIINSGQILTIFYEFYKLCRASSTGAETFIQEVHEIALKAKREPKSLVGSINFFLSGKQGRVDRARSDLLNQRENMDYIIDSYKKKQYPNCLLMCYKWEYLWKGLLTSSLKPNLLIENDQLLEKVMKMEAAFKFANKTLDEFQSELKQ